MFKLSPPIEDLMAALRCLPGVGPKSAQRMALQILERDKEGGRLLARCLEEAISQVKNCEECRMLTEATLCTLCQHPKRDSRLLCVVEKPGDVFALEHAGAYQGRYFVLMGHLSPIEGIGPEEIGVNHFLRCLERPDLEEVIFATNPTMEGEATAYYLADLVKERQIVTSRIAHGVPLGGDLEYTDEITIARAISARARF